MTSEFLSVSLPGIPERQAMLAEMTERLRDMSPVFEFAHIAFTREMREQFATEGAYINGQKWVPLSEAYAKRKPQPPPPYGILYLTGRLLGSLTDESHPEHIKVITADSARFGTSVPYGIHHQKPDAPMPQRKFVGVSDDFRRLIRRAAMLYAMTGELPRVATVEA